ncbi:hypothetical protein [Auritidibacter ignavus]
MITWRAGCSGMGTSGSEGGQQKPIQRQRGQGAAGRPYTYVRTSYGFVYTAFVIDAYSRRIAGWATRSSMTTHALS